MPGLGDWIQDNPAPALIIAGGIGLLIFAGSRRAPDPQGEPIDINQDPGAAYMDAAALADAIRRLEERIAHRDDERWAEYQRQLDEYRQGGYGLPPEPPILGRPPPYPGPSPAPYPNRPPPLPDAPGTPDIPIDGEYLLPLWSLN